MNAAAAVGGGTARAPHRVLITLSVMLASIMQALDNTIANVALPRIQGSLSATQDQMAWVLTSYIIAAAIMTPLSGWLAGQIGRKRVFLFSVVGFTIASALCGLAQSLPEIVLARLLQGLCGAALIPMSQAVLLDISFLGILTFMPETELRKSRFDFFGFTALSFAIGSFQLMLDRGQLKDWFSSTEIWIEAIVAALGFYLFVVHMVTTSKPAFVSPALFKDRNFVTGNVFIFVVGVVLFATLALLPPLLQDLLNYPVVLTGLVTAPRGIGTLAAMFIVGRLMGIVDTRLIIAVGFGLTAFSLWQMTGFYLQMDTPLVVWSGLAQGLGTGFVYVPLAAITFATLSPEFRNEGTALFSLVRNVGSSVGISVVETLLTRNTQMMHSRLGEQITPYNDVLHSQSPTALSTTHGLAMLNHTVNDQAAMIAYNNDFKLMMVLTLCAIPLVLLLRRGDRKKAPEPVVIE